MFVGSVSPRFGVVRVVKGLAPLPGVRSTEQLLKSAGLPCKVVSVVNQSPVAQFFVVGTSESDAVEIARLPRAVNRVQDLGLGELTFVQNILDEVV